MLTLGFYVRPWIKVPYPDIPALGRIESIVLHARRLEAGIPQCRVRQRAPRGSLLGGAHPGRLPDEGVRAVVGHGEVLRPQGDGVPDRDPPGPQEQGVEGLAEWHEPVVNPVAQPGRRADVRERRAESRRRARRRALHDSVVVVRQRVEYAQGRRRRTDRDVAGGAGARALLSARPEYVAALVRAFHADHAGLVAAADAVFPQSW